VGLAPERLRDLLSSYMVAGVEALGPDAPLNIMWGNAQGVGTLSTAMKASVDTPAESTATVLQQAVRACTTVRFRYVHAWTGESVRVEVEPYDVWRRRDRLVLDVGDGTGAWSAYDVSGISELEVLATTFAPPTLPSRMQRVPQIPVVLAVPAGSKAEDWRPGGWNGRVVGPLGDGRIEIAIGLDGDAADPGVLQRLEVLLLQLGAECEVRQPEVLVDAAKGVGRRLLPLHDAD
jgi:hypothetical protein